MKIIKTLIGKRDLDTAIPCLQSLYRARDDKWRLDLYDDGTIRAPEVDRILSAFSQVRLVPRSLREDAIRGLLSAYPECDRLRRENVLAMKLFDVILFDCPEYLEYVDSDVLFLKRFTGGFRGANDGAFFFQDVSCAYALAFRSLLGKQRVSIPARVNTGIIGFPRSGFDLDFLEWLLKKPELAEQFKRTPCWAEQTCWALLAERIPAAFIDRGQGRVVTSQASLSSLQDVIALHFVSSCRGLLLPFFQSHQFGEAQECEVWKMQQMKQMNAADWLASGFRRKFPGLFAA